jgi:hypothetical protein
LAQHVYQPLGLVLAQALLLLTFKLLVAGEAAEYLEILQRAAAVVVEVI